MLNKEKEVDRLLKTPRMFYNPLRPQNSVVGLCDLIKENVDDKMTIVEVGSFSGVSSELFALHCNKIYCVDQWKAYPEIKASHIVEAENRFDTMCEKYSNLTKVKASSEEASKMFEDKSLHFVYIDAAHDYKSIKKDIALWLPKVKCGGFIAGHDITILPVKICIDECFGKGNYKIYPDTSWVFKIH